jgi:hypothetical protein
MSLMLVFDDIIMKTTITVVRPLVRSPRSESRLQAVRVRSAAFRRSGFGVPRLGGPSRLKAELQTRYHANRHKVSRFYAVAHATLLQPGW